MQFTPISIAIKGVKPSTIHGFMIYRINEDQYQSTGILAGLSIADLQNDALPHENTIPKKVEYQKVKIQKKQGMNKPLLLGFKSNPAIRELILAHIAKQQPILDTYLDKYQSRHHIWVIDDASALLAHLSDIASMYIVDGHHRRDALIGLSGEQSINQSMVACFDEENLHVKPFHRIISIPESQSKNEILHRLQIYGDLQDETYLEPPSAPHHLSIALDQELFSFRWDSSIIKSVEGDLIQRMDVNLITKYILHKALKYTQEDIDTKVDYVEGTESLANILSKTKEERSMIILVPSLGTSDFMTAADRGITLPPKSTFVMPRMPSGLVQMKFGK